MQTLTDKDFAQLFGTAEDKIRATVGKLIDGINLDYRVIEGAERDDLLLSVIRRIHAPELKVAGDHREAEWEDGWLENLNDFIRSGYQLKALIPNYYKENVPIRLNHSYVLPVQPDFVYKYTQIFRGWLFQEYLADFNSVYEFGAGTGHNLVHLAEIYPQKQLYSFDWTKSSVEIAKLLARETKLNITGGIFNFVDPDDSIVFNPNSAVLTFGALEQIGPRHQEYIDFLLRKKPGLCIDVIGTHELYEQDNLLDYLALLYHQRRNYLEGYLTQLRALEKAGKIKIEKVHRHSFGNLYDDPYSYIVWRPLEMIN